MNHTRTIRTRTTKIPYRASVGPLLLGPRSSRASRIILGKHPVNGHGTCRCFHGRKHSRLHQRIYTTCSHLTTHCGPIILRNTKDVSRVGLQSASLIGLPVTLRTKTSMVLIKSVSHNNIFTDICNSLVLLHPRRQRHVGKVLVGGFQKSVHLFRSNVAVLRRLYNVPIIKMMPCCHSVCVRRRSSITLTTGSIHTRGKGIGVTIVLLHRLDGFASFGILRHSPHMRLFCAGGISRLTGTSIVLLPNSGDALSSLCRLHHGNITTTVVHTRHRNTAIVNVYNNCRVVKRRILSPRRIRKSVRHLPKLKLLPVDAHVSKRGIAHRIGFNLYDPRSPSSALRSSLVRNCRVRVKIAAPIRNAPSSPLGLLRGNSASNCYISSAYVKACVRNVLSGPRFVSFLLTPFTSGLSKGTNTFSCRAFGRRRCSELTRRIHHRIGLPLVCRVLAGGRS